MNVAIILPVEDASFSLMTSKIIIPIGTISKIVQMIFSARFSNPTAVNATVNRIIGPIKLILPRGPQEKLSGFNSLSPAVGTTHAFTSLSNTGIIFFRLTSAQFSITPKSNSTDLNFLIDA